MERFKAVILAILVLCFSAPLMQAQQPQQEQTEDEWIQMKAEQGESHASGMRPELGPVILGNPTQSVIVLRVGLYYSFTSTGSFSEFYSLNHPFAVISNTAGDVHVLDRSTGKQIVAVTAGQIVRVSYDGTGYQVALDGTPLGTFGGPIFFRPTDGTNFFRVESILRSYSGNKVPLYRGAVEIARGRSTAAGKVNVVNVVELEDYVPGVVVNESISSFHVEALKAQAVAARGYAVGNIGNYVGRGYPFDIVDSSSSQVYRGVISEHVKAVQAASETAGLVASNDGKIISAMYSSSFGGHSESYEWIFNSPSNQWPGTNVTPYLHAIYDGSATPPDFSTEAGVAAFWNVQQPATYDDCVYVNNRFSRWMITLTPAQIKARLTGSRYVLISGDTSGDITDVAVTSRMLSGRAAIVRLTLTSGVVEVRGWDNLRNVLGKSRPDVTTPAVCPAGATAIAKDFTLNNPSVLTQTKDINGKVTLVTAYGGGWGHNVGLSQYGAHGRGKAGQNFLQILKAYYTGVDIGSYPMDIGREPGTGTPELRQQFFAPNGIATLVVRPTDLKGLRVHINETYDLSFTAEELATDKLSLDVSPYLVPGVNTIRYNPVGHDGMATVTVVVE